jgi:hypothetical protein
MVFWIAILTGVLFVWLAVRMGFYETWVLSFNIVIAIYVAIFLAPTVAELAPGEGGLSSYGTALSMALLAGGCFAILQGLSYVFLTGQFSIPFPRVFDILLSGVLGFLAGFLTLSFLALVLMTTPLAGQEIVSTLGLSTSSQQANLCCIAWCCDRVHGIASGANDDGATQAAVHRLLERDPERESPPSETDSQADANQPPVAHQSEEEPPTSKTENPPTRLRRRSIPTEPFVE